jgi:hypothetical protein
MGARFHFVGRKLTKSDMSSRKRIFVRSILNRAKGLAVVISISALTLGANVFFAGPAAAITFEYDTAVEYSPTPADLDDINNQCVGVLGANACFNANGDKLLIFDNDRDDASAVLYWWNYLADGSLYRKGRCRNNLGAYHHGMCNKDFREDSTIQFQACVQNFSLAGDPIVKCSQVWASPVGG